MRTTLDLDPAVLEELKRRREAEGKPIGAIASELILRALAAEPERRPDFVWKSQTLEVRVDIDDKEALLRALDEPCPPPTAPTSAYTRPTPEPPHTPPLKHCPATSPLAHPQPAAFARH